MASLMARSVPGGAISWMTGGMPPMAIAADATSIALPAASVGDAAAIVIEATGTEIDLPAASCGASAART